MRSRRCHVPNATAVLKEAARLSANIRFSGRGLLHTSDPGLIDIDPEGGQEFLIRHNRQLLSDLLDR